MGWLVGSSGDVSICEYDLLCDGICPAVIITDLSINNVTPKELNRINLREPAGELNKPIEFLRVRLYGPYIKKSSEESVLLMKPYLDMMQLSFSGLNWTGRYQCMMNQKRNNLSPLWSEYHQESSNLDIYNDLRSWSGCSRRRQSLCNISKQMNTIWNWCRHWSSMTQI